MKHPLRLAQASDAACVSALVQQSFRKFVAPDWEPDAQAHFLIESSEERLASLIPAAAFSAVFEADDEIAGFILLPEPALLGLLFVESKLLRRGIAKELWQAARVHIETNFPDIKTVELNSSPYAVAAYRALGFYPISEPFRRGGCLATRMACWLPGKSLAGLRHAP